MSEGYHESGREIGEEEKNALFERLLELLPPLQPRYEDTIGLVDLAIRTLPHLSEEQIRQTLDEQGIVEGQGYVMMSSEAKYELAGQRFTIRYDEGPTGREAMVGIIIDTAPTEEGVSASNYTTYRISGNTTRLRISTMLFKRSHFVSEEELQEIFTPQYLAPILAEYRQLKSRDRTGAIEQPDFSELMAILSRLGPDTLVEL